MEKEHAQLIEKRKKGIKASDEIIERQKRIDLNNEIRTIEAKILTATQRLENERSLLNPPLVKKTQEEAFEWIRSISHIVPSVEEDILLYDRVQSDYERASEELLSIDQEIEISKIEMDQSIQDRYPEQIREKARDLEEAVLKYTLQNTFQMIFDEATDKYKKENKINGISGKYHRYDLYARLLFCQMFFDTKPEGFLFICIDEGQDISENEYQLIRDLNDPKAVYNIFGDVHQLMKTGRGISNWAQIDKIIGTKKYYLNENYRNTNQITRFCNESFGMDVIQTGVDGANVRELRRADLESELSSLNLVSERVVLLVPRKGRPKSKYLREDLLSAEVKKHIGNQIGNGYISQMYVDEVKGIEFDKAYIVPKGMTKNEKYIAYTRALSELIIVVDA